MTWHFWGGSKSFHWRYQKWRAFATLSYVVQMPSKYTIQLTVQNTYRVLILYSDTVCHCVSLVFALTDFPTQEPCGAFPVALLVVTLRLLLTWEEGIRPGPWFGWNMRNTQWEQLCLFRQNVLMSGFLKGRELQTSHEFLDVEGGSRAWEEGYYCVEFPLVCRFCHTEETLVSYPYIVL